MPEVGVPPEVAGRRVLLLDHSGNIHSIHSEGRPFTTAYWDQLAAVEALVPEGPIAVIGLGAGTVVHLIRSFSPEREFHGWELDPEVVSAARRFFGLGALEEGGSLAIHTGDVFEEDIRIGGGFAAIVVDIFADASLHDKLLQADTWRWIGGALAPGGRVIANLGLAAIDGLEDHPSVVKAQAALGAMREAFAGHVCFKHWISDNSGSTIAMSGTLPEPSEFGALPDELGRCRGGWWSV